jgi:hypothetical protein
VLGNEKAAPVLNVEESNPRPSWRIRHPLNQQNIRTWRWSGLKNKINSVRSRNVYENKENIDTMPDETSDICAQSKLILQKSPGFEWTIYREWQFRSVILRRFPATTNPSGHEDTREVGDGFLPLADL